MANIDAILHPLNEARYLVDQSYREMDSEEEQALDRARVAVDLALGQIKLFFATPVSKRTGAFSVMAEQARAAAACEYECARELAQKFECERETSYPYEQESNQCHALASALSLVSFALTASPPVPNQIQSPRFIAIPITATTTIKSLIESRGITYQRGQGFRQVTKAEIAHKARLVLRNRDGEFFADAEAWAKLGSEAGSALYPHDFPELDFFLSSSSPNRQVHPGETVVYDLLT